MVAGSTTATEAGAVGVTAGAPVAAVALGTAVAVAAGAVALGVCRPLG